VARGHVHRRAFTRPAAGGTIEVRDKASGETFAAAGLAAAADVDAAIAAAKAAQPGWAGQTYAERAGLLRGVAAALADRSAAMRELIMRETGCIGGKADYEIGAAISELTEAAALASRATGEVLPTGGVGQSGLGGRSGGDSNLEEFTERRWLTVNPGPPIIRTELPDLAPFRRGRAMPHNAGQSRR
jgi:acyl-CoA reductase-like NAD-dependent aldehyde dehydrogenase